MDQQTDDPAPAWIATLARNTGAAVVITDYWLAKRQRAHIAWIPDTDDLWTERELVDLWIRLEDAGIQHAILMPGVRRAPQPIYWIALRRTQTPGGNP